MELTFFSFTPSSALHPFVRCYNYVAGNQKDDWEQTLVPGNMPSLTFIFNGTLSSTLCGTATAKSWIMGQLEQRATILFGKDIEMITVFFSCTGLYGLFGFPMQQFTGKAVDFTSVCTSSEKEHLQRIMEAPALEQRILAIEDLLMAQLSRRFSPWLERIEHAISIILDRYGYLPVDQLAREVNMSKRNLERHFIKHVGVSPKGFAGISRIKKVLQLIGSDPELTWKDISQTLQYSDHSHFIHEFRKFTGMTPGAWSRSLKIGAFIQ